MNKEQAMSAGNEARDLVERLRASCEDGIQPDDIYAAADEIERLRARLAEAERDAARYRWLRDESWSANPHRWPPLKHALVANQGIGLDAAIDAAMERQP